jgi:hypothetical protein
MAVENVFTPKTINPVDPKNSAEKDEGDTNYWQQKAKDAKARLDYQEYEHAMQMLGQKPEPPFKVTGEFNLGKIDVQEQQRQAQATAEQARKDADTAVQRERERADGLSEALQKEKIDGIRRDFENKFNDLTKTIERLATAPRKDERPIHEQFKEQFTALQALAKELGFEKTSTGQDPMIQLELAKLNYQQSKEEREFKWKMRQDEKNFQLQIKQMDKDDAYRNAALAQQARKDDMLASLPQQIGSAIARGVMESEGGGASQGGISQRQQGPAKTYQFEAPEGEGGKIECPSCHAEVGIGSDTTSAECAWCRSKFTITRIPAAKAVSGQEPEEE